SHLPTVGPRRQRLERLLDGGRNAVRPRHLRPRVHEPRDALQLAGPAGILGSLWLRRRPSGRAADRRQAGQRGQDVQDRPAFPEGVPPRRAPAVLNGPGGPGLAAGVAAAGGGRSRRYPDERESQGRRSRPRSNGESIPGEASQTAAMLLMSHSPVAASIPRNLLPSSTNEWRLSS